MEQRHFSLNAVDWMYWKPHKYPQRNTQRERDIQTCATILRNVNSFQQLDLCYGFSWKLWLISGKKWVYSSTWIVFYEFSKFYSEFRKRTEKKNGLTAYNLKWLCSIDCEKIRRKMCQTLIVKIWFGTLIRRKYCWKSNPIYLSDRTEMNWQSYQQLRHIIRIIIHRNHLWWYRVM